MGTCDATGSDVADYVRLPVVIQLRDSACSHLCFLVLSVSLTEQYVSHIHFTSYLQDFSKLRQTKCKVRECFCENHYWCLARQTSLSLLLIHESLTQCFFGGGWLVTHPALFVPQTLFYPVYCKESEFW